MDALAFVLLLILLCFVIIVAISRWIFRINDVVKRLDKIVELLTNQKGDVK
jgi:hypothetical protein